MNTQMYLHPLTASHLNVVSDTLGYIVVGPIGKGLACGDTGKQPHSVVFLLVEIRTCTGTGTGAMTEWLDIVHIIVDQYELTKNC